jgi:transposase
MAENNSPQAVKAEQLQKEIESLRTEMNLLTKELDNALAQSRRGGIGGQELHRLTRELGLVKQEINKLTNEPRETTKKSK